jgi:prepilin-type processing-associated H-X9-DG protein
VRGSFTYTPIPETDFGGANFIFADGSARFLTYDAAPIMPALASRAGGEIADVP